MPRRIKVTPCHTRGPRAGIHKMIHHEDLCHSSASKVTDFLAARILLGHFEKCPGPSTPAQGGPFDVARGRRCNDAAIGVRLLRARLFRRPFDIAQGRPVPSNVEGPVPSHVEGCNIPSKCQKCCISLHRVAYGSRRKCPGSQFGLESLCASSPTIPPSYRQGVTPFFPGLRVRRRQPIAMWAEVGGRDEWFFPDC